MFTLKHIRTKASTYNRGILAVSEVSLKELRALQCLVAVDGEVEEEEGAEVEGEAGVLLDFHEERSAHHGLHK